MTDSSEGRTRDQVIGDGVAWLSRWSLRWLLIAAGAVLLGLIIKVAWPIILPVALALVVTTVLAPVSTAFQRWLRLPSGLAAAATLVGAIGVVVLVSIALAPSISGQAGEIASDATSGVGRLQEWVQESNFVSKAQIDAALEGVQEKLSSSSSSIASGVLVGVGAVTSALITLVVTLILTFLFLKDGSRFRPWVRELGGERAGRHLDEVLSKAWATLGGFIRTQALVSFIDAIFIGLGLVLVGVPLAIPLAVLTFFGGFIPIVGAFVVGAIAVLVALVSVDFTGALIVLAVIIAVQQLEGNVLSPWLQSKSMNLHAGVVLLSVALGSTIFGIIGAFLAVPTVAVIAVILRYLNDQVTLAEGTPSPTRETLPQFSAEPTPIDDAEPPRRAAVKRPFLGRLRGR
ncbi:MAG: AI-2E family transporter [Nocardioides sp.]|nr:AI-2E family transporter [Nocardioides sp.]